MIQRRVSRFVGLSTIAALALGASLAFAAQQDPDARDLVLALAEEALAAISAEDKERFAGLLLDETVTYRVAERDGEVSVAARTPEVRAADVWDDDLLERGFDAQVMVEGRIGMVWLPYDFYVNGELSHCGVDVFTMLETADGWRIASLSWTVAQPPECRLHPDGPPQR